MNEQERLRIYRFGGEGNDWCFVRLPVDYDPQSRTPYRWIICNHGNGWSMDGTEERANWTAKTQFGVDLQNGGLYLRPDTPGFRLYSNPLIEALLAANYIVCGAQNYGDGLYGNKQCSQACADFYAHMRRTYRVTESCLLLGASNGFMTSVNAVPTIGRSRVAALIGVYPLCNLCHAYTRTHNEGVCRAYCLHTAEPVEFVAKAAAFDPIGRLAAALGGRGRPVRQPSDPGKGTAFSPAAVPPPSLLLWSATDTVLPMSEHAVKYAQLIRAAGGIARDIQVDVDGESCPHGDWRHYPIETILSWCEQHMAT
jgi:hypothetical protein